MSTVPTTPRRHVNVDIATTTPTTTRVTGSSAVQSSPHYTTTRRHSLYGTEDRIIIDPGSRIWKVGFSGEGRPRDVFYAGGPSGESLWTLSRATNPSDREEEDRVLQAKIQARLRSVFHEFVLFCCFSFNDCQSPPVSSLLTDPKSRKVILVEHPLLPLYVKDMIARTLFDNLQVWLATCLFIDITVYIQPGSINIVCIKSSSLAPHCRKDNWSSSRLWSSRVYRPSSVFHAQLLDFF
jgi:actin-related protein 10